MLGRLADAFNTAPASRAKQSVEVERGHDRLAKSRLLTVEQDADLPVDLGGDLGQLAGQLRGNHLGRRHLAAVQALQGPGLMGF